MTFSLKEKPPCSSSRTWRVRYYMSLSPRWRYSIQALHSLGTCSCGYRIGISPQGGGWQVHPNFSSRDLRGWGSFQRHLRDSCYLFSYDYHDHLATTRAGQVIVL
ncbi:UNVERIFIED_CONTAM: hypothetical protein Slati_3955700 [Sesamum latifolium]|uniref:Uncharacterized protein n=1 Tax=Sesamum latifolium TaxID=2727402 RepID=A0AAW2TPI8_9LAMI